MLLMFAATLMVGIWSYHFTHGGSFSRFRVGRPRGGLRVLALAIALALVSIPAGAWAKAPETTSAEIEQTHAPATTPSGIETAPGPGRDYAAREVNAKGLEKFEGGDTTVVIAGSTLVIILIVVLIIVLI